MKYIHDGHHVQQEKKIILSPDLKYGTIVKALQENVIIVCLPPHTSHALQPLDVAVFKPYKDHWWRILLTFYRETKMKTVDKAIFPSMIKNYGLRYHLTT